jgi:hypothetical protein
VAHLLADRGLIPGQWPDHDLGKRISPGGQRQRRLREVPPERLVVHGIHADLMLAVGPEM